MKYIITIPTDTKTHPKIQERHQKKVLECFKSFLPEDDFLVIPDSIKIREMPVGGGVSSSEPISKQIENFWLEGNISVIHPVHGLQTFVPTSRQYQFFDTINSSRKFSFIMSFRQSGLTITLLTIIASIIMNTDNQEILFLSPKSMMVDDSRNTLADIINRLEGSTTIQSGVKLNRMPSVITNNRTELTLSNGSRVVFKSVSANNIEFMRFSDYAFLDNAGYTSDTEYSHVLDLLYRSEHKKIVIGSTGLGINEKFIQTINTGRLNGSYAQERVETCKLNYSDMGSPFSTQKMETVLGRNNFSKEYELIRDSKR